MERPSTPHRCSPRCSTAGGRRSDWLSEEPQDLRDQSDIRVLVVSNENADQQNISPAGSEEPNQGRESPMSRQAPPTSCSSSSWNDTSPPSSLKLQEDRHQKKSQHSRHRCPPVHTDLSLSLDTPGHSGSRAAMAVVKVEFRSLEPGRSTFLSTSWFRLGSRVTRSRQSPSDSVMS